MMIITIIIIYRKRKYYITSLWDFKKIHVRLGISSCSHIFYCVGWAWGTTCGTIRYFRQRVRILIDWKSLKIVLLNLERLNSLQKLNISINRSISNIYFKFKQNTIDPLFGNSFLAFIKTGELTFSITGECGVFYSLGFNQGRICYGIGILCKLVDLLFS